MGNVLKFKSKPKISKINGEDVTGILFWVKGGEHVAVPDRLKYRFVQWLNSNGIDGYYVD